MAVMAWFKKERKPRTSKRERLEIPADAWEKCDGCGHLDLREKFEKALNVCPECGRHRRISAEEYIELLTDEGTWRELYADLRSTDPLQFEHYAERLAAAHRKAGDADAIYTGHGQDRRPAVQPRRDELRVHGRVDGLGGRREDRAAGAALARQEACRWSSSRTSGGARMQEGVLSLMQMAKTSAAIAPAAPGGASPTSASSPIPPPAASRRPSRCRAT